MPPGLSVFSGQVVVVASKSSKLSPHVPFDKIKIDRSFVKDFVERTDCVAIVDAISGLGRSLNT
jgi:predicted signal transduction protein with EAL and GGDEF domain